MTSFDRSIFLPAAISSDTVRVNERLAATIASFERPTDVTGLRAAYANGRTGVPADSQSRTASTIHVSGPGGSIPLRVIPREDARGVYLHIHGGGWMLGTNDMQDGLLETLSREAGLVIVSVGYRLAPEHPYPAGLDDCVVAAMWLIENASMQFGTDGLVIGGESAGAHLSASTLLRLRDAGRGTAFRAANLTYGCFDLSLTPSMARARGTAFIDSEAVAVMAENYAQGADRRDPDISPLYADLTALPPALFTVGTIDPLLDDTLFMHSRWVAAGNEGELSLHAGGVHGFNLLEGELAATANAEIASFLVRGLM